MTTALEEGLMEVLADKARGKPDSPTEPSHHTNVFVCIEFDPPFIRAIYGPFASYDSGKDWGLVNVNNFSVMEIMRPLGVENVGFVTLVPSEPTLEDQGIHPDQAEIGDYIDPNIGRG